MTLKAKELIANFYGKAAQRSYFLGCSNGGRQGMLATQRFPLYFDGVVAGAPVFNLSRIVVNQIWNVQVLSRIAPRDAAGNPILAKAFSDTDLKLVSHAVLDACDGRDGLADGIVNDWKTCPFDPGTLAINAWGTVVGAADGGAMIWRDGVMRDLNKLLVIDDPQLADVHLNGALAINDFGWIVANGYHTAMQGIKWRRGYVLIPISRHRH